MTFEQAAQTVANDLGWVVAFVVWTVVLLAVGQLTATSTAPTNSTFQEHRKLYEGDIDVITEPSETRGLAVRETDCAFELIRIAEKDGDYYRSSYFSLYDDEDTQVANRLSEYVCEKEREVQ